MTAVWAATAAAGSAAAGGGGEGGGGEGGGVGGGGVGGGGTGGGGLGGGGVGGGGLGGGGLGGGGLGGGGGVHETSVHAKWESSWHPDWQQTPSRARRAYSRPPCARPRACLVQRGEPAIHVAQRADRVERAV